MRNLQIGIWDGFVDLATLFFTFLEIFHVEYVMLLNFSYDANPTEEVTTNDTATNNY